MSPGTRLAGAVAVLPPLPQHSRLQSSRAVHMRSLAELQKAAAMHTHPDVVYGAMIPDPDYSDDELDNITAVTKLSSSLATSSSNAPSNNASSAGSHHTSAGPTPSKGAHPQVISNSSKVLRCSPSYASSTNNVLSSSPPSSKTSSTTPPPVPPASTTATDSSSTVPSANMVARNNRVNAGGEEQEGTQKPVTGSPLLQHKQQKENKNRFDENGLVLPKKLVNPSLESSEKKNLHRELLFNQKIGASVLNQKTELQRAMEKHKGKQIAKEQEREKQANLTPFQKALEQQALKLEQNTTEKEKTDEPKEPEAAHEFQKLQAKLRSKLEAQ